MMGHRLCADDDDMHLKMITLACHAYCTRKRSEQLVASSQRCAELEMTAKQLREALSQAMSSLQPEALEKIDTRGTPPKSR